MIGQVWYISLLSLQRRFVVFILLELLVTRIKTLGQEGRKPGGMNDVAFMLKI